MGIDLAAFGNHIHPLRASQLPTLMACPWKAVMAHFAVDTREGGTPAQTGSMTHAGVDAWHKSGKEVLVAIKAMKEAQEQYPMAEFPDAEKLFRSYAEDPRNQEAKIVKSEFKYTAEISHGIWLQGTLDQIRDEEGTWKVWDLKTGKGSPSSLLQAHYYQLAAYSVLATAACKRVVEPGGIIALRQYGAKGDKVFLPYGFTHKDAKLLMEAVCSRVREVRSGQVAAVPNDLCVFCCGVPECLRRLHILKGANG